MQTTSEVDDFAPMQALFALQRDAARGQPFPDLALRRDRLRRLATMLQRSEPEFETAIDADFGHRSVHETRIAETFIVEGAIRYALRRLAHWMRPRRASTEIHFLPGRNRLVPQPLGVVGVVSPWNYPLQLSLAPLVGALAAGNRAMLKPSELAPGFSRALAQAIKTQFDPSEVGVVEGGPAVSSQFVSLPFDHLVFTGSTSVGRLVAQAAARNLTPATLELGGKSPAIVDRSADISTAARRIAVGKLLNAGQTCIAPDYVLCPGAMIEPFVEAYFDAVGSLYGFEASNPDYSSIVSDRHHQRLCNLSADAAKKGARVVSRERLPDAWRQARKLPPSIVLATTPDMTIMQEEIFGPLLPVIDCDDANSAIRFINHRDRPLALYWFGSDASARERILARRRRAA